MKNGLFGFDAFSPREIAERVQVIYRWPLRTRSTLAPSRKASEG